MTKREGILFGFVFSIMVIALAGAFYTSWSWIKTEGEKGKLQEMQKTLTMQLRAKEDEIASLNEKVKEHTDKLANYQKEFERLKKESEEKKQEIAQVEERIEKINAEKELLQKALDKYSYRIKRLVRYIQDLRYKKFRQNEKMLAYLKSGKGAGFFATAGMAAGSSASESGAQPQEVTLPKIVVARNSGTDAEQQAMQGCSGPYDANVITVNRQFNFAVIGVDINQNLPIGIDVVVLKKNGLSFNSRITKANRNLMTIPIPRDVDVFIGEKIKVGFSDSKG